MGWFDAVVMTVGLPLCMVVSLVLCTTAFFIFLPAILGVTVTIEHFCDLTVAVKRWLLPRREN